MPVPSAGKWHRDLHAEPGVGRLASGNRAGFVDAKNRVTMPAAPLTDHGPSLRGIPFDRTPNTSAVRLLTDSQRQRLAAIATRMRLPARAIVYRQESQAEWIFIVADGVIKSYRDLPSGRRRVLGFPAAGDLFGLAENGYYVNTTQAVTPCSLYRFQIDRLKELLHSDADLEFQFLRKVAQELRRSQRQTIVSGRRDAAGRLAMFLRMLERHAAHASAPGQIAIPMSRSDIASYLGLTLEAISRATRKLERGGIVTFTGRHAAAVINRSLFDKLASSV